MADNKAKPVVFSNGKPTPWWQQPSGIALIVSAAAALGLGVWIYGADASTTTVAEISSEADASPDAVQTTLRAGKPTIVEFGANNCASCRDMKPVLHALAQDPRIAVADVDILKERGYIGRYQIRLMPTQVFYNAKGEETGRHMGKISGEEILARLGLASSNAATGDALPKAAL
jgi:thioredoxin 1